MDVVNVVDAGPLVPEPVCTPYLGPSTGFAPASVPAAVSKVKYLLVGLAATDEEIAAVTADPAALSDLITRWMAQPQYTEKMQRFFVGAFQQDQFTYEQFIFQFVQYTPLALDTQRLMQNVQESFARTALQLIAEGEPFSSTMTTTRFMMTPAMMATYAILDNIQVDDRYVREETYQREHPSSVTLQSAREIPLERSVDPTSPDFMVFYHPGIGTSYGPGCPVGTIVYPGPVPYQTVADFLYNYSPSAFTVGATRCQPPRLPSTARLLRNEDFTTWRMITIRQPRAGESTTPLYDLPSMRAGRDLVLRTPRVSFFTTPAFYARWPTNNSNLARVLINQTMIVGLGRAIDLSNTTAPPSLAALDPAHSSPDETCYGCHQSLDPMRQFFRHAYSLYGSVQSDPRELSMPGQFAFHGVSAEGASIADLGAQMAAHPMFAPAWVQRLCTYATSAPCVETDPEFVRLVGVFRDSHYSWSALTRAMFSSPLVTYLSPTQSTSAGQLFPIARRMHLCAMLSARLGVADLCGLDVFNSTAPSAGSPSSPISTVNILAGTWPSGQYSRGSALPSLPVVPSLLMRGGMENLCAALASRFVDTGQPGGFPSAAPAAAIHDIVTRLMGLTGARVAGPEAILQNHFTTARREGADARTAMQSTFVLGCLSPYVASVGH